jgi:small neutral amino acid transporter SnatA (MarC family)
MYSFVSMKEGVEHTSRNAVIALLIWSIAVSSAAIAGTKFARFRLSVCSYRVGGVIAFFPVY